MLKSRSSQHCNPLEETASNNLTFNSNTLNMSYYGNMDIQHEMDREDDEEMNIYTNVDPINSSDVRTETKNSDTRRHQTPQHTGSDTVRSRSSRASSVCLVLLCVLLLTAVIVLCVLLHSKSTNCSEETHLLLTHITNLTEERDELLTKNTNVTEERDGLSSTNLDLIKHRDQLNKEKIELSKSLQEKDKWIYSSLYFLSTEKRNWTESRRYCTERGADLIIINNSEEQAFVKKISAGVKVWIGLTDGDVEGRWKWVDSSTPTAGSWAPGEPDSHDGIDEDCAVNYGTVWADYPCNHLMQWICEKVILK